MNRGNVTYIDELMDVEDLGKPQQPIPHNAIRNTQRYPSPNQSYFPRQGGIVVSPVDGSESYEQYSPTQQQSEKPQVSCLDLANHQTGCPICSKLYNCDKTLYIIVIVLLSVICVILLKKVLESK